MTSRPDPRVGTDLGQYHIEAVIGRGGMGVVYLAEQARLGRKVALKIVSPEFSEDPKARARFLRESQMAAAIDHPNILPIYEADESEGVLFIAMRLVEGSDLAARLRIGPMEPRAAIAILGQVAGALDAAHARGLVHRDVKPANILLAPGAGPDQGDHAYLSDFGLTKRGGSDSSLTAAGGFAGTLAYIAPEQVDGREVDGRADQYSLACMAFECLTGQVPFERETDIATAMAHIKDPPPSAVALRPSLPPGIDAVVARGMAKAPDDRYPSCTAFMADLRHALERPASEGDPVPARLTRQWTLVAVVGSGILAVVAIVGWLGEVGATASATPSAPPTVAAALTASPPETSAAPAAFPDPAERALLALLPSTLQRTCERGSYAAVQGDIPNAGTGGALGAQTTRRPTGSLTCPQTVGGANLVQIRDFGEATNLGKTGVTAEGAVSAVASKQGTTGGDCSRDVTRVNGRWARAGVDAGAIVCFIDTPTGDAVIYWSYEDEAIFVRAVNQRGDIAALYDYFVETSRFIAP